MAAPYLELDKNSPLVDSEGKVTTTFDNYLYERSILQGSGSPESVVVADPTTLYMDTAGTAGNILYVKKSGNGNTGWILV
jgi:hypothetical protein